MNVVSFERPLRLVEDKPRLYADRLRGKRTYHVSDDPDGTCPYSRCGIPMDVYIPEFAEDVARDRRCQRRGCKEAWPS